MIFLVSIWPSQVEQLPTQWELWKDLWSPKTSNGVMCLKPEGGWAVDRPVWQEALRAGVA